MKLDASGPRIDEISIKVWEIRNKINAESAFSNMVWCMLDFWWETIVAVYCTLWQWMFSSSVLLVQFNRKIKVFEKNFRSFSKILVFLVRFYVITENQLCRYVSIQNFTLIFLFYYVISRNKIFQSVKFFEKIQNLGKNFQKWNCRKWTFGRVTSLAEISFL